MYRDLYCPKCDAVTRHKLIGTAKKGGAIGWPGYRCQKCQLAPPPKKTTGGRP